MCNCARVGSGRRLLLPQPDCLPATAAAPASQPPGQQLHQQEPKQQAEHAEAMDGAISSSRPQAAKPSGKACALPVKPVMLWGARRRPVAMMEAEQSCMWCGVEKKGRRTREIHSQQAKILYLGISKSDAPSR